MSKIFYLLPSILIAGKLIASDPLIHPGYTFNDDLSSAQPVRIPTEQPVLPVGTPTTIFPIDPGTISNPVVNPVVSNPSLIDDDLGGVFAPIVKKPEEPVADKPAAPIVEPGTIKPQAPLAPVKPTDDSLVDELINKPDLSDEEYSSDDDMFDDENDAKKPIISNVTPNEKTNLNGKEKPQGIFSRFFSGCYSIVCWPFRCFYWYFGYDSATGDTKKLN